MHWRERGEGTFPFLADEVFDFLLISRLLFQDTEDGGLEVLGFLQIHFLELPVEFLPSCVAVHPGRGAHLPDVVVVLELLLEGSLVYHPTTTTCSLVAVSLSQGRCRRRGRQLTFASPLFIFFAPNSEDKRLAFVKLLEVKNVLSGGVKVFLCRREAHRCDNSSASLSSTETKVELQLQLKTAAFSLLTFSSISTGIWRTGEREREREREKELKRKKKTEVLLSARPRHLSKHLSRVTRARPSTK